MEEAPQHPHKYDCANRISEQQLRAHSPDEESRIARMSHQTVQTRLDQHMVCSLVRSDDVGEVGRGVDHGCGAEILAYEDGAEAEVIEEGERRLVGGEEEGFEDELEDAEEVSGVVVPAIEQKEG
jgi:hypothetical protein